MSGFATLLFVWPGPEGRRLRFVDGKLVGRGRSTEPVPNDNVDVILVVPGEEVSIHWTDLPALAPAQARGAARLIAAEVSASPVADLHVAVGQANGDDRPAIALTSHARMGTLLAEAAAAGLDPLAVVPEPLLLRQPVQGVARLSWGDRVMLRGPELSATIEPDLAALLLSGDAPIDVDEASFEAGLPDALANCPLDLRQGEYARGRRYRADRAMVRWTAMIVGGALILLLASQIVLGVRYHWAARQVRDESIARAQAVLPGEVITDPTVQLDIRLGALRGPGAGFARTAEALFAAMSQTPNVELAALGFADGAMQLSVNAAAPDDIPALVARIEALGFTIASGPPQTGGGVSTHQLQMRSR